MVERIRALIDEKRVLLERVRAFRETIVAIANLISEIDEKFKIPVKVIYRSSLVSSYRSGDHRVDYRVWAHSNEREAYSEEELTVWMERLIDARPPNTPELREIISDRSNWGYEKDKEIGPENMAPPDAKMDTVYGHAVYDIWQYLFEQRGDAFVEIASGPSPSEVRIRLNRFGIEVTEEQLRRGRRVRHR